MLGDSDPGHRETQTELPRPTDGLAGVGPGGWGLPAMALTWGSMIVGSLILCALQSTETMRLLFRLPIPPSVVALLAAVLASGTSVACRNRPGRQLPRLWPLGLAITAAALAIGALADSDPRGAPWLHAAALACLGGALTLVPRLLAVPPDRSWAQRVVPASFALAMLLIFTPAVVLGWWGYQREVLRIEETIGRIESWVVVVEEGSTSPWSDLGRRAGALERQVVGLEEVDAGLLATVVRDRRTRESAAFLGLDRRLEAVLVALGQAVSDALDPSYSPHLSTVDRALVRWDPVVRRWLLDREAAKLGELVARYHRRLGELLVALDPGVSDGEASASEDLRTAYAEQMLEVGGHLKEVLERWGDHWVVGRIPAAERYVERVALSLEEALGLPLGGGASETLAAADLWSLMSLDPGQARAVAEKAPGCWSSVYREGDREHLRIDCQDYGPDPRQGSEGAVLSVELRIVYSAPSSRGVEGEERPREVFLLFPVPTGRAAPEYREVVAGGLVDAVAARWDGGMRFIDRSGSARHGFVLSRAGRELVVYRATTESFLENGQAVVVRAEWL